MFILVNTENSFSMMGLWTKDNLHEQIPNTSLQCFSKFANSSDIGVSLWAVLLN